MKASGRIPWNIRHLTDILEFSINDLEKEANNDVIHFTDNINLGIFTLVIRGMFWKHFPLSLL